jgi:hypothetical protein
MHYILGAVTLLIVWGGWYIRNHRSESFSSMAPSSNSFLAQLERLGYFKYTSTIDLPVLQQALTASLQNDKGFSTVTDPSTGLPLDYRMYAIDGKNISSGKA